MKPSLNFADVLGSRVDPARAGRLAMVAGDRSWTYGEMAEMSARAASVFRELGAEPGVRVLLLMLDGPEFVAAFHGAGRIGALPVPLNTVLAPGEYEYLFRHSAASMVVVSEALLPVVRGIRARCPHLAHVVVVGRELAEPGLISWGRRMAEVRPEPGMHAVRSEDPAFWLYSSGSSGSPKAVVHAHGSIGVTCEAYARQTLGLTAEDRCFSAAKLFHAYGLGNGMNFPLSVGASSVLWSGPPLPEVLFEQLARHRPTVFFATPTLFNGMLAMPAGERDRALGSVRFCVSAGEALPSTTFERWKARFGLEIVDGIGSTEMLHIFLSNRPGDTCAGSSGREVPGYRAQVVDEAGEPVGPGVIGDLWVAGASATLGYHGDAERTGRTLRNGWVVTGDKYRRDEEGRYWFQGRSDDMLKVNGLWVSPAELEHLLQEHPAVRECAVIGIRDAEGLTQIKAFVVLREEGGGATEEGMARELQAFAKRRLPQRYPRLFEFVAGLPKTATGKVKRYELREAEARA